MSSSTVLSDIFSFIRLHRDDFQKGIMPDGNIERGILSPQLNFIYI